MEETIEFRPGEFWDNNRVTCKRIGITQNTAPRWRERGLLPTPIKIGTALYYNRKEVDKRMRRGEPFNPETPETTA